MSSVVGVRTVRDPRSALTAFHEAAAGTATPRWPERVGLTVAVNDPSVEVFTVPRASDFEAEPSVQVSLTGTETPATPTSSPPTVRLSVPDTVTGSPW